MKQNMLWRRPNCAFQLTLMNEIHGCTEALEKLFRAAELMPAGGRLGVRIDPAGKDCGFSVTLFSDTPVTPEDAAWIFLPYALPVQVPTEGSDLSEKTASALLSADSDCGSDFWRPHDDGRELLCMLEEGNVSLRLLIPTGTDDRSAVLQVCAGEELPLRFKAALSGWFCDAKLCSVNGEDEQPTMPAELILKALQPLLVRIHERENAAKRKRDTPDAAERGGHPLEEADLSVRAFNCLKRAGFHTLEEVSALTEEELRGIRNLGRRSCEEVCRALEEHGLSLAEAAEKTEKAQPALPQTPTGAEQLNALIGLSEVKEQVRRITALAKLRQRMEQDGRQSIPVTLNMAFTGNPGTAKTTVARILARILREEGILESAEPLEVGRAELVARYVGQTAEKVREVFRRAKGRLLFIDEAYSLVDDSRNSFADEAINTLVQEIENHRADTVVVLAGYPEPMERLLSRNEGLRSRIPFVIPFRDYTGGELLQITVREAERRGFTLAPEARERLTVGLDAVSGNPNLGGGRCCRNLVEDAILSYADRVFSEKELSGEPDYTLQSADFHLPQPAREGERRRIGF